MLVKNQHSMIHVHSLIMMKMNLMMMRTISIERKLHHSDSLHLLRKKVQHEDHNTSDDESELSSFIEQQQIIDGV